MPASRQAVARLRRIRSIQHKQAAAAAAAARAEHEETSAATEAALEAVRALGSRDVVAVDRFVMGHGELRHAQDLEHLAGATRAAMEQRMREAALAHKRADELHERCETERDAAARRAEARDDDDRPLRSPLPR